MTEYIHPVAPEGETIDELRSRAEALQRQLTELQQQSDARLIRAEMKAEAIKAGMIDLDCLTLLDLASLKLNAAGEVEGATGLMAQLRRGKPWLFGTPSSSSSATAPSSQAPRQKHATEMTDAEYAAARTALLKQHY